MLERGNFMSKSISSMIVLAIFFALVLGGCAFTKNPVLKGGYQSEHVNGYVVQLSFQPIDNSFIQYIDNREVDKGTYEQLDNGVYKINGEIQQFEITLNSDDSFEIIVKKLNDGKPITLENIGKTPIYFSPKFDDVEEYRSLIEE